MKYDEARRYVMAGIPAKRLLWEQTKIIYDQARGTLACVYDDGLRRKFIPNNEERDATDWTVVGPNGLSLKPFDVVPHNVEYWAFEETDTLRIIQDSQTHGLYYVMDVTDTYFGPNTFFECVKIFMQTLRERITLEQAVNSAVKAKQRNKVFEHNGSFKPALFQTGKDKFIVRYGTQTWTGNYEFASKKLGEAIMHSLTCDGNIF